jgi:hypothetical protein
MNDAGIIRNRLKIDATIHNAKVIMGMKKEFGSFKAWLDNQHPKNREGWTKLFKQTDLSYPVYLETLTHEHPVMRYWGAYGLFRIAANTPTAGDALLQMMQKDDFAANRIMAAQALAWCEESDRAFDALVKETRNADVGYVLLQAINALQYSKTDDRLTLKDWQYFWDMPFENDYGVQFAHRIIDDAFELYPERRKVY